MGKRASASRAGTRAIGLAALIGLVACGTLDSRRSPDLETSRIYSGARRDLSGMGLGLMALNPGFVLLFLIDLPLSTLADTLLLPVTIPEDARRRSALAESLQTDHDVASVIPLRPGASDLDNARRLLAECERRLGRLDPVAANCYAVEARIVREDGTVSDGRSMKRALRPALREARGDANFVRYADPVFELAEGGNVRIRATRVSSFDGARLATQIVVGPGPDGGWRILEETAVRWPLER